MLEIVLWLFEKVNTFPKKTAFCPGPTNRKQCPILFAYEVNFLKDNTSSTARLAPVSVFTVLVLYD